MIDYVCRAEVGPLSQPRPPTGEVRIERGNGFGAVSVSCLGNQTLLHLIEFQ